MNLYNQSTPNLTAMEFMGQGPTHHDMGGHGIDGQDLLRGGGVGCLFLFLL